MYFDNCHTQEEAKRTYRRLAMLHHPDKGGSTAVMQDINAEYSAFTVRHTSYTPPRQEPPKKARKPRRKKYYSRNAVFGHAEECKKDGRAVWYGHNGETVVVAGTERYKTTVAHLAYTDAWGVEHWTVKQYNVMPKKYAVYF